jgi:hypothetical protein
VDNILGERMFDVRGATPSVGGSMCSASLFGDVEGGAYHGPHSLGINPRLQRPVHCPTAELGKYMIMG